MLATNSKCFKAERWPVCHLCSSKRRHSLWKDDSVSGWDAELVIATVSSEPHGSPVRGPSLLGHSAIPGLWLLLLHSILHSLVRAIFFKTQL